MTESEKQQVELNPLPCPFCGECEIVVGNGSDVWTFCCRCLNCHAKGPREPDIKAANASWKTRVSPDREKIREALALLERYAFPNDSTHGCSVIGDGPDLKHCEDCDLGNAISVLKGLVGE